MNYSELEHLYILVVGLIGVLTICIMTFSISSNKLVNLFLVMGLLLLCVRMLLKGSFGLGLQHFADDFSPKYRAIVYVCLPFFYLYFKSIISDYSALNARDMKHLLLPFFIFGFNYFCISQSLLPIETIRIVNVVFSPVFAIFYLVNSFSLLK